MQGKAIGFWYISLAVWRPSRRWWGSTLRVKASVIMRSTWLKILSPVIRFIYEMLFYDLGLDVRLIWHCYDWHYFEHAINIGTDYYYVHVGSGSDFTFALPIVHLLPLMNVRPILFHFRFPHCFILLLYRCLVYFTKWSAEWKQYTRFIPDLSSLQMCTFVPCDVYLDCNPSFHKAMSLNNSVYLEENTDYRFWQVLLVMGREGGPL